MSTTGIFVLTDDALSELKAKHGELRKFTLERGEQTFLVRGPSEAEFNRALDKMAEAGRRKMEAIMEAGEACIVFPPADVVARIASAKPGLFLTAGNAVLQMAGVVDAYAEKV